MYDQNIPEDLDTDGEDHVADEVRYFCMARPIKPRTAQAPDEYKNSPLSMFLDIPKEDIVAKPRKARMEVIKYWHSALAKRNNARKLLKRTPKTVLSLFPNRSGPRRCRRRQQFWRSIRKASKTLNNGSSKTNNGTSFVIGLNCAKKTKNRR